MFARIADLTWQRPKLVLAAVGVFVLVAIAFGARVEQHLKPAGFTDPSSESERAQRLVVQETGNTGLPAIAVLVRPRGAGARLDLGKPATQRELVRLAGRLRTVDGVARVELPGRAHPELIARDGRSALLTGFLVSGDEELGGTAAKQTRERMRSDVLATQVGGYAASFNEVNDTVRKDLVRAELIAFPVLALLLLIVFRGVVAAGIPLAVGGVSVVGTFLALRIMATFVDTSIFALNITTALGLGLAVDYGLLLVSRFREELEHHGGATREAHRRVVETAGHTVLYSGMTVATAMAALTIMPQRFLYSMGAGGAIVAVLAALSALFVVPAMLALLGERVNALSLRRGPKVSDASGGWYRLASAVMRRPVPVALASSAVLLALAVPTLGVELTGPTAETVPPGKPSRQVSEVMARDYGPGLEAPISVTVDGPLADAQLARLRTRIAAIDGVALATPFRRLSPQVAQATVGVEGRALSGRTRRVVQEIRALDAPAPLLVSGNTAEFLDLKHSLGRTAPFVVGLIALTTLVLLFLLTGSVLLPLKTLLMNVLTMAATLGIVVAAFQWGWLDAPLDYPGPAATEISMIVVLFAVTFGLATDYAVLVLARIKELHDTGMSNDEAVAVGMARTGRVITAAAICLAAVFLAFASSSIFFMKQMGIGQALAVLIDASIVRALLVPALMRMLGDWNWWAPAPLRRFQQRFGFSEA